MKNKVTYIILLLLVVGCGKGFHRSEIEDDKKYYPLEIGNWVEFDVDSVILNDFFDPPKIDTSHSIIRFQITDTLRNNLDNLVYKLTRFWRANDTSEMLVDAVWTAEFTNNSIQHVEENQRIVKLVFPIKPTTSWKGNSFFFIEEEYDYLKKSWVFEVDKWHQSYSTNGQDFDSVVSIKMVDSNLIEQNIYEEIYAKNIGLVYRKNVHLEKQNLTGDWENGFYIEYTLRDFKK